MRLVRSLRSHAARRPRARLITHDSTHVFILTFFTSKRFFSPFPLLEVGRSHSSSSISMVVAILWFWSLEALDSVALMDARFLPTILNNISVSSEGQSDRDNRKNLTSRRRNIYSCSTSSFKKRKTQLHVDEFAIRSGTPQLDIQCTPNPRWREIIKDFRFPVSSTQGRTIVCQMSSLCLRIIRDNEKLK